MNKTVRAVILSGGSIADYDYIRSLVLPEDTVICADSGYDHALAMGLFPAAVVGDFDSVVNEPQGVRRIPYPPAKDATDTELAIAHARELGFRDFLLLGGMGARMDHTLANILLLKDFLDRGERAEIADERNRIMLTRSEVNLSGGAGDIVSLVPLAACVGVSTLGLLYPLCEAELRVGTGLGVSNVMLGTSGRVSVRDGLLFVIQSRD